MHSSLELKNNFITYYYGVRIIITYLYSIIIIHSFLVFVFHSIIITSYHISYTTLLYSFECIVSDVYLTTFTTIHYLLLHSSSFYYINNTNNLLVTLNTQTQRFRAEGAHLAIIAVQSLAATDSIATFAETSIHVLGNV